MAAICRRCGSTEVIEDTTRKRITCKDGVSLSVQVGRNLYCHPREDNGPWTNVEVGFITDKDDKPMVMSEEWWEYSDGENTSGISDVYGYVPVELVERFIMEHGGRKLWV